MNPTGHPQPRQPASFTLSIDGMSCSHCVRAVSAALAGVPGVVVRSVSVGSAQITARDAPAAARAVEAVVDAGFTARAAETPAAPGPSSCGEAAKEDRP